MITEIGAVKVRGGELLGRVPDPGQPAHRDPAVHRRADRHHQLHGRRRARDRVGATGVPGVRGRARVLVAHNAPFDVGFLKHFAAQQGRPWPRFEVLDTAMLARRVITRDEAPNCKLSSLAARLRLHHHAQPPRAVRRPRHRRRAARPDGAPRQSRGPHPRGAADLHLAGHHRPAPQAPPRRGTPPRPRRLPLPRRHGPRCSTSAPRATCARRVRSYFTASETRSRMGEMVGLAELGRPASSAPPRSRHEVRELRLIAEHKPRYNRRSRNPRRRSTSSSSPGSPGRGSPWSARCSTTTPTTSARSPSRKSAEKAWPPCTTPSRSGSAPTGWRRAAARSPCVLAEMGRCLSPCDGSADGLDVRRRGPRSCVTPCSGAPTTWSRRSTPR